MGEIDWSNVLTPTVAIVCGLVLGWNREKKGRAAGLRTQMLVSLGAANFIMASIYVREYYPAQNVDLTRAIEGVAGGIGFLGAGTIIRSGGTVKGVTTAATVWMSGAIGVLCGLQWYSMAILSTVFTLVVLVVFGNLSNWLEPEDHPNAEEARSEKADHTLPTNFP